MEWPFVSRREYQRALAERNDADRCFALAKTRLSEMEEALDQIAEDALWYDGHDNSEALEDIRKTVKSLGYTQVGILAAAEEQEK